MKLDFLSIKVENFKAFRGVHTLELARKPGLYYVSGRNKAQPRLGANGVGKSTLFVDAFYWCLTGRTIRSAKPGAATESWGGASKKERSGVELTVAIDGEEHVLIRTRRPNSLTLDGKTVTQEEVDAFIPIPDEALRRSILIGQFGRLFLDMKAEEQSQMFTEALSLDLWIRASQVAATHCRDAERAIESRSSALSRAGGALEQLQNELRDAKANRAAWEKDRTGRLQAFTAAIRQAQAAVKAITPPQGRRPTSQATPGATAQARQALTTATRQQAAVTAQLSTLRATLSRYNAAPAGVCPECGQKVEAAHIKAKLADVKKGLAEWGDKLTLADAAVTKAQAAVDELAKREQAVIPWQQYDHEVELAERDVEAARDKLATAEEEANPWEAKVTRLVQSIVGAEADLQKHAESKAATERELKVAQLWRDGFKEIRLNLIDSVTEELEVACNRHAVNLGLEGWETQFSTERETSSGSVSTKFTALIWPPKMEEPIPWESYSGGESQRWNLADTFGLAEVLLARAGVVPNIEVLDEPTAHLSQEGIDDLLDCLRERALELNRAIYLIDHRSLDRGAFDGVITIEGTKNGSRVV